MRSSTLCACNTNTKRINSQGVRLAIHSFNDANDQRQGEKEDDTV